MSAWVVVGDCASRCSMTCSSFGWFVKVSELVGFGTSDPKKQHLLRGHGWRGMAKTD